jgi:hypothetical protein
MFSLVFDRVIDVGVGDVVEQVTPLVFSSFIAFFLFMFFIKVIASSNDKLNHIFKLKI